jgi:hypothetical protein
LGGSYLRERGGERAEKRAELLGKKLVSLGNRLSRVVTRYAASRPTVDQEGARGGKRP